MNPLDKYIYYKEPAGVIYCGDCLEILPLITEKVDLVLTDPPYGIGEIRKGSISNSRLHKNRYTRFKDTQDYVINNCVPAIRLCIKMGQRVILTPGFINVNNYPPSDAMGCFYMPASVGVHLWGRGDFQPILYYGKPYDVGKSIHSCSYQVTEAEPDNGHPYRGKVL
ncbi:MAG: hypothetical protein PHW53_04755 [Patescibacteria group bacterium]|nr:hypothetical protein [Patescibacteria group bacterium]